MRYYDVIALIALLVLAVIFVPDYGDRGPTPRRPGPPPPAAPKKPIQETRRPTRPPAPPSAEGRKPGAESRAFDIELGEKKQSTGTAFAVSRQGHFLTARHVTDGCKHIAVKTGPRRATLVTNPAWHPNADLSVLKARFSPPALNVRQVTLRYGQDGYHFGFPKGKPGAVHSTLIGRTRMRIRGRYRSSEPVSVWAQQLRIPDIGTDLSGISGGPILDAAGTVVGVHIAGNKRRGRAYAATPATIIDMLRRQHIEPARPDRRAGWLATLNRGQFDKSGAVLRQRLSVTKVYCLLDDRLIERRRR